MAYAILRVAKLKTMGNVGGHGEHVERQRQTLNADPTKMNLNQRLAGTNDPMADVQVRFDELGIQPRKGAVVAIDVFISASPEHFQKNHPGDPNWKAFQAKAIQFLRQEYGADNIVHAMAHHDETSPHLHAIVTPIRSKTVKVGRTVKTERTEHRLCARDWLGGDRSTLSRLQTRFADSVKDLGLSRGIEGSKAKHTQVSQFYALMNETTSQAQTINQVLSPVELDYFVKAVPKPGLLDIAQPHKFAQAQVRQALGNISEVIQQTNQNVDVARRGQLVNLQTPVRDALVQKGQTRQSQAERALEQLGYRLDVHGQLVNILEARKKALRATITRSVGKCTTSQELWADLASKGIQTRFEEKHQQTHQGKIYNGVSFDDGKGAIWGHELGPDYTTMRLIEQIQQLEVQRQKAEREKLYQATVDGLFASYFQFCKGDANKVAQLLAKTTPQQREETVSQFKQIHGQEGADYARRQLERFNQLTTYQLATKRDSLKQAGHEVGLSQGKKYGQSLG